MEIYTRNKHDSQNVLSQRSIFNLTRILFEINMFHIFARFLYDFTETRKNCEEK